MSAEAQRPPPSANHGPLASTLKDALDLKMHRVGLASGGASSMLGTWEISYRSICASTQAAQSCMDVPSASTRRTKSARFPAH